MPYIAQTRDLTKQYLSYGRILSDYRPVGNTLYTPGTVVQLVPLDLQVYPDEGTVAPVPPAGFQGLVMGVVCESWPGFSGVNNAIPQPNSPPTFLSPSTDPNERGTAGVLCVVQGYHPSVNVDVTAGATIADGTILVPSTNTAGAVQGAAAFPTTTGMGMVGIAMLPATGPLSSLATGPLLQASGTVTITGTLGVGASASLTITPPSGLPVTVTVINTGSTGTATQVAAAFAAALTGSPYVTASAAAGVLTITANGQSYLATVGQSQFPISLSGVVGNGITATVSGIAATVVNPSGGTGYVGTIPVFVTGALC